MALAADPARADDPGTWERYNAACDAVLAGVGEGKEGDTLDAKSRSEWRRKALAWLRADLALWATRVERGGAEGRKEVREAMEHWREDGDFVAIRDENALKSLSDEERSDWQALWAEVEALIARTRE